MSKIGVELARSIDEQQRIPRMYKDVARTDHKPMMHSEKQNNEDDQSFHATAPATKKRRTSASNEKGDDKLQEFLQVMQPPSKFRDWDSEGLFAGEREVVATMEPEKPGSPVVEANDFEAQEPVSVKRKHMEHEELTLTEHTLDEHVLSPRNDAGKDQTLNGLEVEQQAPQAASDETWLRSRTSRLLGLIGNDDDGVLTTQSTAQKAVNDTNVNNGDSIPRPSVNVGRDEQDEGDATSAQMKQTSHEMEMQDVGNGRLFLRNLTYTCTEQDIHSYLESKRLEGIEEVPTTSTFRFLFRYPIA